MQNNFWTSFFSISDLSAPIVPEFGDFDAAMLSERANVGPACAFETPRPSYDVCPSFGDMISEIDGWCRSRRFRCPTAPVAVYNYTANSPHPNGRFEQRQDLDLHNGIRGHLVDAGNAGVLGFTNYPVTFDPAVMGPGDHKEAVFWTQTASDASVVSVLIVVDVQVDSNAPPPCADLVRTRPRRTWAARCPASSRRVRRHRLPGWVLRPSSSARRSLAPLRRGARL